MNKSRFQELLVAVILSLGMLFVSAKTTLAETEPGEIINEPESQETTFFSATLENTDDEANEGAGTEGDNLEDDNKEEIPYIAPEEVKDAIDQAQTDEAIAAGSAIFTDPETREEIIAEETTAIIESGLAEDKINKAEEALHEPDTSEEVKEAEQKIDDYSEAAQAVAEATSEEKVEESSTALEEAKDAYHDAKDAEYIADAQEAADRAKAAYETAKALADEANSAYDAAVAKYNDAEKAYDLAKAEYDKALEEAKNTADQGVEELGNAVTHAGKALEAALAYYNNAKDELDTAEENLNHAKTNLDTDWNELKKSIDELGKVIAGSTGTVIQNVGETVVTGIGYSISDAIANYYGVLTEYKKGQITELENNIELAEKQLAADLQYRLDTDKTLTDDDKAYIQNLLMQIVIRNIHKKDVEGYKLTEFKEVTDIDGISISDNVPEGHTNGKYIAASDKEGHTFYYEVRFTEDTGEMKLFPITFTSELIEGDDIPTADTILKDATSIFGFSSAKLEDSYVLIEGNQDTKYDVYAIEYSRIIYDWLGPIKVPVGFKNEQKIILQDPSTNISDVLNKIGWAIASRNYDNLSNLVRIVNSLDDEDIKLFNFGFTINDEDYILISSAVEGYHLNHIVEDDIKDLHLLVEEYDSYIEEQEEAIAAIKEELYGDDLNQFIQENLDTFVTNNLDKIVDLIRNKDNYHQEKPDFWETITASVGNINWSNADFSHGLYDGISDLFNNVTSSLMDGIMSYAGKLISSSLPSAEALGNLFSWDMTGIEWGSLNIWSLLTNQTVQNVTKIITALQGGNFDKNTVEAIKNLLDIKVPLYTKKAIADAINKIMERLHHDAYENLKSSISDGRDDIIDALDTVGTNAITVGLDLGDYLKAGMEYTGASIKEKYAEGVVLSTYNACISALTAYLEMNGYRASLDYYVPEKLQELYEEKEAANAELLNSIAAKRTLNRNARRAKQYWEKAQAIVPTIVEYNVWVSGKQISNKNAHNVFHDKGRTVSYDAKNGTLYLSNADISVEEIEKYGGLYTGILSIDNIKIVVKGNNSISSKDTISSPAAFGICADKDLSIIGGGKHPVLSVDLRNASDKAVVSYGIVGEGNINIRDIDLIVNTGDTFSTEGFDNSCSAGIYSHKNLTISNSNVTASSGKGAYTYGMIANEVEFKKSNVESKSGKGDVESAGIYAERIYVNDSEIVATGGKVAYDKGMSTGILLEIFETDTNGLQDSGFLTANTEPDHSNYYLEVSGNSKVFATGGNSSYKSYGIYGAENDSKIRVKDNALLVATGGNKCKNSYGIQVDKLVVKDNGKVISSSGNQTKSFGVGIEVAELIISDHARVNASSKVSADKETGGNSVAVKASKGITIKDSARLKAEVKQAKNSDSWGISGNVTVNDRGQVSVTTNNSDRYNYGIFGDLIVNGTDTKKRAQINVSVGDAEEYSIGIRGNITTDLESGSVFDINVVSGNANHTYGMMGDINVTGVDNYSTVYVQSGNGIESYGIYNEAREEDDTKRYGSIINLKNVILHAASGFSDDSEKDNKSYGIYADVLSADNSEVIGASGVKDGVLTPDFYNGEAIGIYVENNLDAINNSSIHGRGALNAKINTGITANNLIANDNSIVSGIAGCSTENSTGIYIFNQLNSNQSEINGYTGNSVYGDVYGIYVGGNAIIENESKVHGNAGNIYLEDAEIGEDEFVAESAGLYVKDLLEVSKGSVVEGRSGSIDFGKYSNHDNIRLESFGVVADTITVENSNLNGYTAPFMLSKKNKEAEANSYGIYANTLNISAGGVVYGNQDDSEEESYIINRNKEFDISDGIFADVLNINGNSEIWGYGNPALLSTGIEIGSELNAIDSSVYGTAGDYSDKSIGILLNNSSSVVLNNSVLTGNGGTESTESYGIFGGIITLKDTSSLDAKSESGYGLANGTIYALDHSAIVVAGGTRAFNNAVKYFFDGRDVRISNEFDGEPYTYWNRTDALSQDTINYVSIDHELSEYVIVSGAGQTWKKDSSNGAAFIYKNTEEQKGEDITFSQFDGIWVDGKLIDPSNYTAEKGSVIVTLKPSFLNSLSAGEHSIIAYFKDGKHVSSKFHIAANVKPTPTPGKKTSGGTSAGSVVTCQMAGYPNGYAWNEAAKACQPGYIDDNGVFHSYKISGRYNTPNTADEGMNPFYLLFFSMMSAAAMGYVFRKEN